MIKSKQKKALNKNYNKINPKKKKITTSKLEGKKFQ